MLETAFAMQRRVGIPMFDGVPGRDGGGDRLAAERFFLQNVVASRVTAAWLYVSSSYTD